MRWINRPWILTVAVGVAVGLAIALLSAFLGRGGFMQVVMHMVVAVWGVPLLLLIALTAGLFWWRKGYRWAARLTRGAIAGMIGVVIQLSGVVLGIEIAINDIAQAKTYCEQLVPKLQTYRDTHGQYPEAIADLGDLPALPYLLHNESFYYGEGEHFSFTIDDPTALFGAWQYNNRELTWQYVD